jgi:hypothetical protein
MATRRPTPRKRATQRRKTRKPSRRRAPRKHTVHAAIENFELTKAGSSLGLEIYAHGEKLGTLEVGRGSLFWWGRNRQRRKRIDWTMFAEMMDRLAYGDR